MSKGNMLLGQARGRVGSLVFARRAGQQITRTYNANPSNPKTRAQALQRAQFATVIAASVGLKEVINNSFDGSKNGQESVNKFVSENLSDLRARGLAGDFTANEWLVPKGQSFVQPQDWILSKGSVGKITLSNLQDLLPNPKTGSFPNITGSDISIFYYTGKMLSNLYCYKPGCQLTFVTVTLAIDPITNARVYRPRFDRVVFNSLAPSPTDDTNPVILFMTGGDAFIPTEIIDLSKSTLESETKEGSLYTYLPDYLSPDSSNPKLGIAVTDDFKNMVLGLGIITTYLEEDGYKHTTSIFSPNYDAYDYTEDAVASYMAQAARKVIDSDYYTEQPTEGYSGAEVPTLEEVVSAQISAAGMQTKGVFVGKTNSYGPVAEGAAIQLVVNVPYRFSIVSGTVKVYNGETPLNNDWQIVRVSSNIVNITGPMPTTTSFPLNASFKVYDGQTGSDVGTAALRVNVSKANA